MMAVPSVNICNVFAVICSDVLSKLKSGEDVSGNCCLIFHRPVQPDFRLTIPGRGTICEDCVEVIRNETGDIQGARKRR